MGRMRVFQLMVGVWALVGVPVLCTGGLLTHPCAPPAQAAPPCHSGHEGESESEHPHESDCLNDPCQVIGIRSGDRLDKSSTDEVGVVALMAVVTVRDGWVVSRLATTARPMDHSRDPDVWLAADSTVLLI